MKRYLKLFIGVLVITLLVFGVISKIYISTMKSKYEKEYEEAQKKEENFEKKDTEKPKKKADLNTLEGLISVSKRVNILLMGTDGGRADTIILASYEPDKHLLDFVTIPRDTYHEVPGYDDLAQRKINAVYGFGSQDGGGKGMKVQVGQLLGVPVHFYVIGDYQAVANIVDTVGDIQVEIEWPMHYDDVMADPPLHIHFDPGVHDLNGQSAIEYLRWRKNNGEYGAGDVPRTQRQMDFLKKLIIKVIGSLKYDKVIQTCYDYIKTDMPLSEVTFYATTLFGFDPEKDIESSILPGEPVFDGLSYYVHEPLSTKELMKKIYRRGMDAYIPEPKPEKPDNKNNKTDTESNNEKKLEEQ